MCLNANFPVLPVWTISPACANLVPTIQIQSTTSALSTSPAMLTLHAKIAAMVSIIIGFPPEQELVVSLVPLFQIASNVMISTHTNVLYARMATMLMITEHALPAVPTALLVIAIKFAPDASLGGL